MFTLKSYKVRELMKEKKLDTGTVASRAKVGEDFIKNAFEGKDVKLMDFAPLVRLSKVLNCSPFDLVQNRIAF